MAVFLLSELSCVSLVQVTPSPIQPGPEQFQGWSSLSLSGLLSGVNSQISKSPSDQSVHSVRAWEHSDPRVLWVLLSWLQCPLAGLVRALPCHILPREGITKSLLLSRKMHILYSSWEGKPCCCDTEPSQRERGTWGVLALAPKLTGIILPWLIPFPWSTSWTAVWKFHFHVVFQGKASGDITYITLWKRFHLVSHLGVLICAVMVRDGKGK